MVLAHLAVREFGEEEEAAFRAWLLADCLPAEPAPLALEEAVASWFARERILRLGSYRLDRLVHSARATHDDAVLAMIAGRLKYLNNRIEADHGALKRLIRPTTGFQSMKTAYATIKGFEVMRMIRRRHCMLIEPGVTGEVRFVNKLFDLAA